MRQIPVMFGLLLSLAAVAQEPADTMQRLIGLWGAELNVGPLVGGELTIDGRGSQWHAYIAGFDSGVRRTGAEVSFVLPGNAGEFRGQLRGDRKTMGGQWIQPPNSLRSIVSPALLIPNCGWLSPESSCFGTNPK